ncbi:GNAT family N-acetyltransferase [Natronospirillum operosum]|uniref:GNAT family N-acetyltransferase n=1 Tax=Natronospirillum operosum TaxID=2759953 RepID=UPI003B834B60
MSEIWALIRASSATGVVTDFVVAESHRGTGVASELMRQAEDFCQSLGLSTVKLSVLHAKSVARGFYEKSGYLPYEAVYRKVL